MITVIYTTVKDQLKAVPVMKEMRANTKDKVSARVLEFWQGEIERCDQVLVGDGCDKVAEAYKNAGITTKNLFNKPVVEEPVVEIIQDQPRRGRPRKEQ